MKKNEIASPEISTIQLPTGEKIEFNYNETQRKDLKGGYGLKSIIIKNAKLERDSKIELTQSYFVKNVIKTPSNQTEDLWSRLCLTGIQKFGKSDAISEKPYQFDYYTGTDNTENFVPPLFFHARDPWGFYNGDYSGASLNNFLSDATPLKEWRGLCTYYQSHYVDQLREIFSTRCKQNYATNGLLKSYTTSDGQTVGYKYSQNMVNWTSDFDLVGGVHVSEVNVNTGADGSQKLTRYSYTLPGGRSSLWGVEPPRFITRVRRQHWVINPWIYPVKFQGINLSEEISKAPSGKLLENVGEIFLRYLYNKFFGVSPLAIAEKIIDFTSQPNVPPNTYFFHRDPINYSNPLPSQFSRVVVRTSAIDNGIESENGWTEYEFTSDLDFPPIIPIVYPGNPNFNPHFFSQSQRSYPWMYGLPKSIKVYRSNLSSLLHETINIFENKLTYNSKFDNAMISYNCYPVTFVSKRIDQYHTLQPEISSNFTHESIPDMLYLDNIYVEAGYPLLKQTIEKSNLDGIQLSSINDFEYNLRGLLKLQKTTNSNGKEIIKKTYYYDDFYQSATRPDNIFTKLYDQNRGSIPIATETWQLNVAGQTANLISSQIFEYGQIANGDLRLLNEYEYESEMPENVNVIKEFSYVIPPPIVRNPSYFKLKNQIIYNNRGVAVQFKNPTYGKSNSLIFAYDQQKPIATINNASADEVAYTSFETDEKNNWEYSLSRIIADDLAVTGKKCLQLGMDYTSVMTK